MYNENEIELSEAEHVALAALPQEMPVGDLLEEKTVRALREAGHFGSIARHTPLALAVVFRVAAAIALFAGGVATGRYLVAQQLPETASTTLPPTQITGTKSASPQTSASSSSGETVVAEREMWM